MRTIAAVNAKAEMQEAVRLISSSVSLGVFLTEPSIGLPSFFVRVSGVSALKACLMAKYRTAPTPTPGMPPGIPYIVGNEAAERFSFYGMRTILIVFMVKYLHLMGTTPTEPMSNAKATENFHTFVAWVYLTPFFGAILADAFFGKYRTIVFLSLGYCVGHGLLAMMGSVGDPSAMLFFGLAWIVIGAGGIKSCVSAHVGDQFGKTNAYLLPKIFNYFYWAINFGAFFSTMLTPWLLQWYGPHWAFGVPGVLMAIAAFVFWMGRRKFIHVPAKGGEFVREAFSKKGLSTLLRLCIVLGFVTIFWSLFDQTGSSWVLQAQDTNLHFLGMDWLPSQVQAINPILILIYIPLFTFVVYPAVNKVWTLTPLRKMSIGFFVMVIGFGIVALLQESIDSGGMPSIGWQFLAFTILTAAEVMISIVGLEFSYTQAPKTMKSLVMGVFFVTVFLGNYLTAGVNWAIQVPDTLTEIVAVESGAKTHPGFDGKKGTDDDIEALYKEGERESLEFASKAVLDTAAKLIDAEIKTADWRTPKSEVGQQLLVGFNDPWGQPLRYRQVTRNICRISSDGPDKEPTTKWDEGIAFEITIPEVKEDGGMFSWAEPEETWLSVRQRELGVKGDEEEESTEPSLSQDYFVGGQTKLEGAPYFWFFTILMGCAAVLFVVVASFYTPKEHLHDEE
ncbi:MAG: POT family proton-dependent oligopeptide transporter [Verrucomicrobiales bacterium]